MHRVSIQCKERFDCIVKWVIWQRPERACFSNQHKMPFARNVSTVPPASAQQAPQTYIRRDHLSKPKRCSCYYSLLYRGALAA